MLPLLIIVTGAVASGKTTLSQRLAADLALPLIGRDRLKEIMFDTLGWSDRAWSQRVGGASYSLLYYALEVLLKTHHPCIVESNFQAAWDRARLQQLCETYGYRTLEICCTTTPERSLQRFIGRIRDGSRHPGHADATHLDTLTAASWSESPQRLDLDGPQIIVDTTDDHTMGYPTLVGAIRQQLASE